MNGNVCRVILNGYGLPATVTVIPGTATSTAPGPIAEQTYPGNIRVERYGESDMLLLGVPTVLA
jgi:hypothetical protein